MLKYILCLFLQLLLVASHAQYAEFKTDWQFRKAGTGAWHTAVVPGAVHTDLYHNKLIADPFFSSNEKELEWIDKADWEYKTIFAADTAMLAAREVSLYFEGLDTYADVYINNQLVLQADNMFRTWVVDMTGHLIAGQNELRIWFHSAKNRVDSIARSKLPFALPDNARVYARKAQYQFGWDWGPKFIGAGIWKPVKIKRSDFHHSTKRSTRMRPDNSVRLVQQKDSIGTSFHFEKDGKPFFARGANWIPAHAFPAAVQRADYRDLLLMAKDANMNMLRVWGGGIYEADYFYELCDSLGIMVWQDFMFAGGMYPEDKNFFANIKAELEDQVGRLKKFNCIKLWCGNNEIDEAWHHWGWQNQFNLHGEDSALVWNNYTRLFRDSLPAWVHRLDPYKRPYISTSPQYGWGNPLSYKNGDSHYWGLWWGLEGWEKFKTHTGRFVSEWGMQAMPDYTTVEKYTPAGQRTINSPAVDAHQKATDGFKKLNHYINRYFFDTAQLHRLSLEEYTYLTQCVQYYIIKNSLAIQLSKQPANMGTLVWQLNDCWPVTSWSIIDYYKKPKAGFYAVKNAFHAMDTLTDAVYPKNVKIKPANIKLLAVRKNSLTITSSADAWYIAISTGDVGGYLSDNYFNLQANKKRTIRYNGSKDLRTLKNSIKIISLADIIAK